ncbi:CcdB family protein [Caenispirillum bisanense]|uniref:CcdB family protein n=1 Tax=Caenispirillum bisanense TaxID=414052 RepID=UPI0031D62B31
MRQFDVVRNTGRSRTEAPYWLIVQSTAYAAYDRRVVIPLVPAERLPLPQRAINPSFEIEGRRVFLHTLNIASLPRQALGEVVASLADQGETIITAIDWLLSRAFD